MSIISLARQPKRGPVASTPRVLWDHPIVQAGLVGFWAPGYSNLDLLTGYASTPYTSGGRPSFTKNGNRSVRYTAATGEGRTLGSQARYNPVSKGITVAVLYTPVAGSADAQLLSRDDDSAGRAFILAHNESGNDYFLVFNSGGGVAFQQSSASVTTATERMLMGTFNNVGGGSVLIRDGVVLSSAGTAPFTMKSSTGATTLGYRTYSTAHNPFDGDITIGAIWNRSLYHASDEVSNDSRLWRDFCADPWQILTWKPVTQVYILSGGVTGTPQALAGTIAGTSTASGTTLLMTYALAGSSTGTSTMSGTTPSIVYGLTGSSAGTSVLSGTTPSIVYGLNASTAGTSAMSGTTLTMTYALVGSTAGTSSTTGDLSLNGAVTADPNALKLTYQETGHTLTYRERGHTLTFRERA